MFLRTATDSTSPALLFSLLTDILSRLRPTPPVHPDPKDPLHPGAGGGATLDGEQEGDPDGDGNSSGDGGGDGGGGDGGGAGD